MLNFGITPQKTKQLYERMTALEIFEKDIVETFIRSGGKGGQNLNKVATCVQLKHNPTGLIIKCQDSRQQALNRYKARCSLADKIDALVNGSKSQEEKRRDKIRKQKQKRKKRTNKGKVPGPSGS